MSINKKEDRDKDANKILSSAANKKVVVAGPGTGKSFLFQEAIKRKQKEGKNNFLAITFIGKLCDELADDLAGLAQTMTLHGFARDFLLRNISQDQDWKYYPKMEDMIRKDVALKNIKECEIGDENYKGRTYYYRAIGDADVVHYAVQICKENPSKIPQYDLVLIDEFQDFNEKEAEFIDLLATKSEMLVVGDDDQALYEFKGSDLKFIKDKYAVSNTDFESHTLKYCSRCPQVIIDAFHSIVNHYTEKGKLADRIDDKEYICYTPDKENENLLNPKIQLFENIPGGMIATKIKYELQSIVETQKIKSVLIIGESKTCSKILSQTAKGLKNFGFKNVKHPDVHQNVFTFDIRIVNAYRILSENPNSALAWRLLIEKLNDQKKKDIILGGYEDPMTFINLIPQDFKTKHISTAKVLEKILTQNESSRNQIVDSSIEKLKGEITTEEIAQREILIKQLIRDNKHISRPLANLDITVCNILGSKGLGADVVFLIGFDQGKLPLKKNVENSEIYQMLVALTRTKKRMYLINTTGKAISDFSNPMESFLERQ